MKHQNPPEPGNPASHLPAEPPKRVPMVSYLVLEPEPHLLVWECTVCAARFFDRRNACAACGATDTTETTGETEAPAGAGATETTETTTGETETTAAPSFTRKSVSTTGHLRAFSVVHRAAGKIKVPFVAAVVEADDGTMIRSNLLVKPDPDQITFPMRVRLDTYPVGTDSQGSECVAFGFAPLFPPLEVDRDESQESSESTAGEESQESKSSKEAKQHKESKEHREHKEPGSTPETPEGAA